MKFRLHGATLGLEPGGDPFPLVALCVIRGTPLNFRSRRTSRPTEADAGTGEFDPNPTFNLQFRVGIRANRGFDRPRFANHSQSGSGSISKRIAARPCHAPSSGATEGASSTGFIITKQGAIVTRPNSDAIRPGCTRQAVVALAERHSLTLE